ncbi:MAG: bifunctional folylpolyglutamate synthase/dihydrofolate synthase [Bacteroidaceae bacterium]|nr:bifunctional folylpolyglutamate synthase/dihydrofolate synthase [Bacteroidaceae bacterium]MBR5575765.1 bifunctional folylpolyglutamate synthase/dihydrofolate synthase [Bacteroidaceae bacterium]
MTYSEATEYLFTSAPLFQNIGAGAYKEGLSNTETLDAHHEHPHRKYLTIHVAGTNGKGSTSHTLAAILQSAGYRVGLYTSPHLVDFRERIRVNGEMIPEERVVRFVEEEREFFEPLHPSFFELATALAFKYFEEVHVDIAVIETGLGGRLDCTNIISPILSIITNISFDHVQFLGNTLTAIAGEKAGIIKPGIPVVVGETGGNADVRQVFVQKAEEAHSPICFADEMEHPHRETQLKGFCQQKNTNTILSALGFLKERLALNESAINEGFMNVCELTGLMGRWQTLKRTPLTVCDTGHNVGGWEYLSKQLEETPGTLHIVIGMVGDKDVRKVVSMLPKRARYYFTQASVARAMPVEEFAGIAMEYGLEGRTYDNVVQAYNEASAEALAEDTIFIGGSTFVVADLLANAL